MKMVLQIWTCWRVTTKKGRQKKWEKIIPFGGRGRGGLTQACADTDNWGQSGDLHGVQNLSNWSRGIKSGDRCANCAFEATEVSASVVFTTVAVCLSENNITSTSWILHLTHDIADVTHNRNYNRSGSSYKHRCSY